MPQLIQVTEIKGSEGKLNYCNNVAPKVDCKHSKHIPASDKGNHPQGIIYKCPHKSSYYSICIWSMNKHKGL